MQIAVIPITRTMGVTGMGPGICPSEGHLTRCHNRHQEGENVGGPPGKRTVAL